MNTGDDELTILVVAGIRYLGLLVSSDGGLMNYAVVKLSSSSAQIVQLSV